MLNSVFAVILSIVSINDLNRNCILDLLSLILAWDHLGGDDLEFVSSGGSVLSKVISGLDDELYWCSDGNFQWEATGSVGKRFDCSCVEEVVEGDEGCRDLLSTNLELHDGFFWSELLEAWGCTVNLSWTDEGSLDSQSLLLGNNINWSAATGEVNVDVYFLEALSYDNKLNITGKLTKSWVGLHDSI